MCADIISERRRKELTKNKTENKYILYRNNVKLENILSQKSIYYMKNINTQTQP